MVRKTQSTFKRRVGKGLDAHTDKVLRETWWLLWVIPLYVRESILGSNW